jgi:uncharacterized protein (TIGR02266 family)
MLPKKIGVMRILKARYKSASDLLAAVQGDLAGGGLFIATREVRQAGEPVLVEVRFPQLQDRILLRGVVAWRRPGRAKERQGGVAVEFAAEERHKVEFMLSVARGETQPRISARNHRRLPVSMPVEWRVKEARAKFSSTTLDIGPGGAFIRTDEVYPVGTPLVLELTPPGAAAPLDIEARVAWLRKDAGNEGLGIEFRCRDTGGLRRLKELIRRLEQATAA